MKRIFDADYILTLIMELLNTPLEECEGDEDLGFRKTSDNKTILCKTEEQSEMIAEFFKHLYGGVNITTGYYDPTTDELYNCVDECTGYYYVNFENV